MTPLGLQILRDLKKETDGTSAVEYGLIGAGIALLIGAAAALLGDGLSQRFDETREIFEEDRPEPPPPPPSTSY